MAPVATILLAALFSLALTPASMAGPIPRQAASSTSLSSVSSSTSASTTDIPVPVFTFGPSRLPHASAPTLASAQPIVSATGPVLEMDWLS